MRSGSASRPRLHGARVLTGAGRRGLHRGLRYAFLAWALLSTAWLLASYRTRGVAAALLASDARVAVQRTAEGLSFRPIGTARSTGLVFIVGAGVAVDAYVPLLRPLAEQGFPVELIALPYRIAPLPAHKAEAIRRAREVIEHGLAARTWVLAGHSLGAALACELARALPPNVRALVLLGTSHPKRFDLSGLRLPITKVYASHDGIATLAMVEAHRHRLPTHTRWVEIAGGNHAQFAHYGPQLFDGRPTISREAQQAQAREALLQALTP